MKPIDPRHIEILDEQTVRMFRKKTPAEKIAMVFAANRTARLILKAQIRRGNPEWSEEQINREVARRMSVGTT